MEAKTVPEGKMMEKESDREICRTIVEVSVVDECWRSFEYRRLMSEILTGDKITQLDIEKGLKEAREMEEAEEAILKEEAAVISRLEKVKSLECKDGCKGVLGTFEGGGGQKEIKLNWKLVYIQENHYCQKIINYLHRYLYFQNCALNLKSWL